MISPRLTLLLDTAGVSPDTRALLTTNGVHNVMVMAHGPSHEQLVALIGHEVSADDRSWLQHHSRVLMGLAIDAARRRLNAQPKPRPLRAS